MDIKKLTKHLTILLFFIVFLSVFSPLFSFAKPTKTEVKKVIVKKEIEKKEVEPAYFNKLTFDDLVKLSIDEKEASLQEDVNYLLYNPYVDNSFSRVTDKDIKMAGIGPYIRVAEWNIARGMNLKGIQDALDHQSIDPNKLRDPKKQSTVEKELSIFRNSDIIILNEVDIGMPRTNYLNVVKELAKKYGYNYAFGLEFLEVDPVHLGLEDYKWSEEYFLKKAGIINDYQVNKDLYKGYHGNAILSKFPLENVRIVRLPKYYDWFKKEKEISSKVEDARRIAAEHILYEGVFREIRVGGRMALVADVKVPTLDDKVTIVSAHLENRTEPKNRNFQMEYLLNELKSIKNPIVMAGDFNTLMSDGSPVRIHTIIKSKLSDPDYLIRSGVMYFTPVGWGVSLGRAGFDFIRKNSDPTVKNIPVILPNKERALFNNIKKSKFEDGYSFDFSGNPEKSVSFPQNAKKMLSVSNQRTVKGFVPTFRFEKHYKLLYYKLDWFFVKAYSADNGKKYDSVKMSPHYGRTLYDMNYGFQTPLSDHAPITIDLPLTDYVKQ